MRRSSLLRPVAIAAAVAVVTAVAVTVLVVGRGGGDRPQVIVYGDSLSAQASDHLLRMLSEGEDADVALRVFGGTAPCDWIGSMRQDAEDIRPDAVVIQFAGNAYTPCMRGPDGEALSTEEVQSRYAVDLSDAVEIFNGPGAAVYLVTAPLGVGLRDPVDLSAVYRDVATRAGPAVEVVDAGDALRDDQGGYPPALPCLPHETPAHGCDGGRISVRSRDGVHFCDDPGGALACPAYSSGAWRFARAASAPLRRDLGG